MKALCDRSELLLALSTVAGVVPTRSPKPVLQGVKLVVGDDVSQLMATDIEVGIRCRVAGVQVQEPGAVMLPAARAQSILRTSTDDVLSIETADTLVSVRGLRSEYALPTESPDVFPDPPEFGTPKAVTVGHADLVKLVRRTIFATDAENTRYALGGVLVERNSDTIAFVATDGRRLARAISPATGPVIDGQPVIPLKALKLIQRAASETTGDVRLAFTASSVLVQTDSVVIYSRLVEGRFPRYQDVFPASAEATAAIEAGELLRAVEQAAIVASEESRGIDFHFDSGMLRLSGQAVDVGRSRVEVPITYDGPELTITIDPRYLADTLKALDATQSLTIELVDHKNPVVLRTGDDYVSVVMPLMRDQ